MVNIKCVIFFNFDGLRGTILSLFFTRVIDLFAMNWAVFLLSFSPTLFSTVFQLLILFFKIPKSFFIIHIFFTESSILFSDILPFNTALYIACIASPTSMGNKTISAPASNALTHASPADEDFVIPPISNASVTIIFLNPNSSFNISEEIICE